MPATLRDVARLSGVSISTASNVMNEVPKVAAATVAKVRSVARVLDYHPNRAARSLRGSRTGLISLVIPELDEAYFATLADDVIDAASQRGFEVITVQTNRERQRELEAAHGVRRAMTDGLIIFPVAITEDDVPLMRAAGPTVMLREDLGTAEVDHVTEQDREAARVATRELLSLGHRRIAILGAGAPAPDHAGSSRVEGYRQALTEHSVPFEGSLLQRATLGNRDEGEAGAVSLLDRHPDITAVFALNDSLAIGAMRGLRRRGLRVPQDVSVLGWDDVEEGRYHWPQLSSVDGGARQQASFAVDALIRRIEDPHAPIQRLETSFRIVMRDSTGSVEAR
ncbi:LacI family DNA-binding transcriptional regulator [Plantibacter sp. CFBP 8804]|uniref:LacI family DNA-binding transcriptional regulator n=1 Tax=Plantibacter sp. CFBP 8804 TaxID=2775270 RepID=UPI00177E2FAE|nr:LacI family DNA-binding transcriptional regulator [Plantibacter sp. CFBP 8804]MBD8519058.1 LacI family DNA-binding transcriptional regulator [Plantibacter sp. CFBP 8804]